MLGDGRDENALGRWATKLWWGGTTRGICRVGDSSGWVSRFLRLQELTIDGRDNLQLANTFVIYLQEATYASIYSLYSSKLASHEDFASRP